VTAVTNCTIIFPLSDRRQACGAVGQINFRFGTSVETTENFEWASKSLISLKTTAVALHGPIIMQSLQAGLG